MAKNGKNNKRSNGNNKQPSFADMCNKMGANPNGIEEKTYEITDNQISRLETALEEIKGVGQNQVYEPVSNAIKNYRKDDELNKEFLDTLFKGIYEGLTSILHASEKGGFQKLNDFMSSKKYLDTLNPRIEYMDALVDLANTASKKRKQEVGDVKSKCTYDESDLNLWGIINDNFKKAIEIRMKYENKIPKSDKKIFSDALKTTLKASKSFYKSTYQIAEKGTSYLFSQ